MVLAHLAILQTQVR